MAKVLRQYRSTIYGNYRLYYAKSGMVLGVVLWLVVLLEWWLRSSQTLLAPNSWVMELVFAAAVFYFDYRYRKTLPDGQVTLKELMLVGLGIGVVSAVVYGLLLWTTCGVLLPEMGVAFCEGRLSVMPAADESAEASVAIEKVRAYSAGDWGFIGAFRLAVWSVLVSFIAAIAFRTEKAPLKER